MVSDSDGDRAPQQPKKRRRARGAQASGVAESGPVPTGSPEELSALKS